MRGKAVLVLDPTFNAERLHPLRRFCRRVVGRDHLLLAIRQRLHILEPAIDRWREPVIGNKRVERLDEPPGWTVDDRHQAGVHVLGRTAAPLLAARDELDLDHTLGTKVDRCGAVPILSRGGHENADGASQGRLDLRIRGDVSEVRRADLLFAFCDEDEVHRGLHPRVLECVERGEERRLRPLLIDRTPAHQCLPFTRTIDHPSLERRGRPFSGVVMLDIVHEIDGERALGARIEGREHAGNPLGRNDPGLLEPRIERQLPHMLGAFRVVDAHIGDGRKSDPFAQTLHRFGVVRGDLGDDFATVGGIRRRRGRNGRSHRDKCSGAAQENPA